MWGKGGAAGGNDDLEKNIGLDKNLKKDYKKSDKKFKKTIKKNFSKFKINTKDDCDKDV